MAFEWNRIHKWEENVEREVTDAVFEYIFEHYGVDEITELNGDQIAEIEEFRAELNEYSVMQIGFSNFLMSYESEMWDLENG